MAVINKPYPCTTPALLALQVEEEIATLRAVLASKLERSAQLKRDLGMYGIDVARDDMKRAAQTIAQSKP